MIRILILPLLISFPSASLTLEVTSYAKVSKNGQQEMRDEPFSWITRALSPNNVSETEETEGRSVKDIVITVSPVYVAPKIPKLGKGEAIDHRPTQRYSTLDHEMIAKLDATTAKKQIQDRYNPSSGIIRNPGSSNGNKQNNGKPIIRPISPSASDSFDFSKPPFPGTFDYKPPGFLADKPISKPITIDDYPGSEMNDDKPPDSYEPKPDEFFTGHDHDDSDFSDYPPGSSYGSATPTKPIEFSGHPDHPPFQNDHYEHGHGYHHDVIYDHIPDYHDYHHDHHEDHTEQPEMNDQRLDKRPYSYYFIGKKLWYVPLYFSIYLIIYIAALVLKSIARHKINFPAHLAEVAGHSRKTTDSGWWDFAGSVLEGVENFAEKFGRIS